MDGNKSSCWPSLLVTWMRWSLSPNQVKECLGLLILPQIIAIWTSLPKLSLATCSSPLLPCTASHPPLAPHPSQKPTLAPPQRFKAHVRVVSGLKIGAIVSLPVAGRERDLQNVKGSVSSMNTETSCDTVSLQECTQSQELYMESQCVHLSRVTGGRRKCLQREGVIAGKSTRKMAHCHNY